MRLLTKVYCKKDDVIKPHYLMIEDDYSLKQLRIKLEREGYGELIKLETI